MNSVRIPNFDRSSRLSVLKLEEKVAATGATVVVLGLALLA
jgi:hypothetical protein